MRRYSQASTNINFKGRLLMYEESKTTQLYSDIYNKSSPPTDSHNNTDDVVNPVEINKEIQSIKVKESLTGGSHS